MFIGLTGGIGAGKSTVSSYLKSRGYAVLDADQVAREIVEPGTETLLLLTEQFGENILNKDGSLNRKGLAGIVFQDEDKKKTLDNIMHGKVIKILLEKAEAIKKNKGEFKEAIVFFDVPLLFESGMDKDMDIVWVVDAEEEVRIQRVIQRDKGRREDVLNRMKHQMKSEDKIKRADVLLDNSKDKKILYNQIDKELKKLKERGFYNNENL